MTNLKIYSKALLIMLCILSVLSCSQRLPKISKELGSANVSTKGNKLILSTGLVKRVYELNEYGLRTLFFGKNTENISTNVNKAILSDWKFSKNYEKSKFIELKVYKSDDEKFTDEHLCVEADFSYPFSKIYVKYLVWVYPEATGIRTQLKIKAMEGYEAKPELFKSGITEVLNLNGKISSIKAFGYMQGIKTNMNKKILTEQVINVKDQEISWASGLIVNQDKSQAFTLIKESNKTTSLNDKGDVATGSFFIKGNTIICTGMGMYPEDISKEIFMSVWANWIILSEQGDDKVQLSIKMFDRRRYPIHPDRDIFIMANTWGTADMRPECLYAAREENVLKEIESIADLGIDLIQIDDGWQTKDWMPAVSSKEYQRRDVKGTYTLYPQGWSTVKDEAAVKGVKLGLWAAWVIPLEKLYENYVTGEFSAFKLDFANLNSAAKREDLMNKARSLIKYSDYKTCVNWDVTEIPPRVGYYYGREYGNVYLENRKINTARPEVQYIPYKVLQDAWLLSKFVNLNKFQITVQNVDMAMYDGNTDAYKHSNSYAVGISLMGSPIFFQETHFYNEKARKEIKPLLAVYKAHRNDIYSGYVFPIGDMPDNKSWSGFQNYRPETKSGYLTIFRELHNVENSKEIKLKFLDGKKISLTNLLTNEIQKIQVVDSKVKFEISQAAKFSFYQYKVIEKHEK